jgi:putative FmdB family regulatory protein
MPIYEYICQDCHSGFELLVRSSTQPKCPNCAGTKLDKQLSVFAANTKGERAASATPMGACGTCGDPRGPGSCALN